MADKPKCSQCNERDVFSKGLCSGCYGKNWRLARKAERDAAIAEQFPPKQLISGVTEAELVIEGEIVEDTARVPETHLTAVNPVEMQAAQGDLKAWLEQRLAASGREIVELNRALTEEVKSSAEAKPPTDLLSIKDHVAKKRGRKPSVPMTA